MSTLTTLDAAAQPSRYAVTRPDPDAGFHLTSAASVAAGYERDATERIADIETLQPPAKEVKLHKIIRTTEGYAVASAGAFRGIPDAQTTSSGRYSKRTKRGGVFLDSLFSGGPEWKTATDAQIWEAAAELAADLGAEGNDLRRLNIVVQLIQLARHGFTRVKPWQATL